MKRFLFALVVSFLFLLSAFAAPSSRRLVRVSTHHHHRVRHHHAHRATRHRQPRHHHTV
ncbi:MAG TPA: hypothetical protein VMG31_17095 [Verrucomicrobiae bacterium]|nr:hypothetical protein [Verrucomicrobiae bacterium]